MRINARPILVLLLVFSRLTCWSVAAAEQTHKKSWSADLTSYGATSTALADNEECKPKFSIAATTEVVAVAFGKASAASAAPRNFCLAQPWEITLLFFDQASGKLVGKSGPRSGNYRFEVFGTPRGNFLLHYEGHSLSSPLHEFFMLLSPSGSELKRLDLGPIPQRAKGSVDRVLVSPSGQTIYIGESGNDGLHCKVIDAETLEDRLAWTEPHDSRSPGAIAISDNEMLGVLGQVSFVGGVDGKVADSQGPPMLRSFGGKWHEIPKPDSGQILAPFYGFLENDKFFAAEKKGEEKSVRIVKTNGEINFAPVFPQTSHSIRFPVALEASRDGRYFGFLGARENWGNHLMLDVLKWDDTFWDDDTFVYLWRTERPDPVAKIDLGTGKVVFAVLGGDSPGVASIRGTKLQYKRVQSPVE